MAETVTVAGVPVDQATLERMFEALAERGWGGLPGTYTPRLRMLKPITGPVASYEQVLHECMTSGSMPAWFRQRFMGERARGQAARPPEQVLEAAGFPQIVWAVRRPWDAETPEALRRWAEGTMEVTNPWLWVTCADGFRRAQALAQAALAAPEQATYVRADELCEAAASAPLHGENNMASRIGPYKSCRILLLDGLGDERHGPQQLDVLASVIKARHERMLPTALGSAMDPDRWVRGHRGTSAQRADAMGATVTSALSGYGSRLIADSVLEL